MAGTVIDMRSHGEQAAATTAVSGETDTALRVVDLHKRYGSGPTAVTALDGVGLTLPAGTFTVVMGPSGSGKSTLLQCAAGLDAPTSGRVFIEGAELTQGSEAAVTRFRRRHVGFVFQQFNLLPTLTVLENVALPLRLAGRRVDRKRCEALLARVGLTGRSDHRPAELSGGQQQRAAVARALAGEPRVIFADEPTGALDSGAARDVLALLAEAVTGFGRTVVMVTHDPMAASYAHAALFLTDGRLVGRLPHPTVETITRQMTRLREQAVAEQRVGA